MIGRPITTATLALALGLVAMTARAQSPARRVATFPLGVKGDLDSEAARALQELQHRLDVGPSTKVELDLFAGERLEQKLGMPAGKALGRCERLARFEPCLKRLVRMLNAQEILTGRFEVGPTETRLLVLAIDQSGKASVRLDTRGASPTALVASIAAPEVAAIYAVPFAPPEESVTITTPPPSTTDDLTLIPIPPPPPPPVATARVETTRGARVLRWAALATLGAGLATAGAGAYLGMSAKRDASFSPDGVTTQRQAFVRYDEADDKIAKSKVWVGAGGALVAAGAILLVVDLTF